MTDREKLKEVVNLYKGAKIMFGKDFFRIFRFALELIKLMIKIFGDDDDRNELDNGNGTSL